VIARPFLGLALEGAFLPVSVAEDLSRDLTRVRCRHPLQHPLVRCPSMIDLPRRFLTESPASALAPVLRHLGEHEGIIEAIGL
jgi:hypothetical protein